MDLSLLESFLEVARCHSLTDAARALGVSQSGLTRQMQRLEQETETRLFHRARSGLRLTPAGERYRRYAVEALALHRRMMEEIHGETAPVAGELRLAASTTPSEFLVPRLVADFTARHPLVQAIVATSDSEGVVKHLLDRRWELGIVGARLARSGLRYEPVAADEVILAVPAGHRFAGLGAVPLGDLANQCFIEREGGSGTSLSVHRALTERGLAMPPHRVGMTLGTTQAILAAVRDGYGIGFVSSLALADRSAGRAVAVRLAEVTIRRSLYLVWEEKRALAEAAQAFIAFCLEQAARGPDEAEPAPAVDALN